MNLTCAHCGTRLGPDDEHTKVDAEHVDPTGRNSQDEFVFHPECWERVAYGWVKPA
jgi:hypothetical protein